MAISQSPFLYHGSYGQKAKDAVISPASGQQIALYQTRLHNRSGGALDCAVLKKLAIQAWSFYKVAASTTDVTTDLQAGSTVTIFESNNHGFIAAADRRFNLLGLTVAVAETGSPVYTIQYWNGSTWATLTPINVPSTYSTGTQLLTWSGPIDWATGSDVGGVADGMYAIKVLSSTAPSTAVQINAGWGAVFIAFQEGVADNGYLQVTFNVNKPYIFESMEGLLPYFGNSTNIANVVEASYSISG